MPKVLKMAHGFEPQSGLNKFNHHPVIHQADWTVHLLASMNRMGPTKERYMYRDEIYSLFVVW